MAIGKCEMRDEPREFHGERYEIPQNDEKSGELRCAVRITPTIDSGRVKPHAQKGLSVRHFYWRRKWDRGGRAAWGKRKGQGSSMGFPTIATPSETNHPGVI
jgi:hypothetical protein